MPVAAAVIAASLLSSCVTTVGSRVDVLEIRAPDGGEYQRVYDLGGCQYRVITISAHEREALDLVRRRVGEYSTWSVWSFMGDGPIYFPVDYDGRPSWEVDGVAFQSLPILHEDARAGQGLYGVRAASWGDDTLWFLFSRRGDYLGVYSTRLGMLGVADPVRAEAFYARCRP